jgi:hypothetical protein
MTTINIMTNEEFTNELIAIRKRVIKGSLHDFFAEDLRAAYHVKEGLITEPQHVEEIINRASICKEIYFMIENGEVFDTNNRTSNTFTFENDKFNLFNKGTLIGSYNSMEELFDAYESKTSKFFANFTFPDSLVA